jgi:hypothetical protein
MEFNQARVNGGSNYDSTVCRDVRNGYVRGSSERREKRLLVDVLPYTVNIFSHSTSHVNFPSFASDPSCSRKALCSTLEAAKADEFQTMIKQRGDFGMRLVWRPLCMV